MPNPVYYFKKREVEVSCLTFAFQLKAFSLQVNQHFEAASVINDWDVDNYLSCT